MAYKHGNYERDFCIYFILNIIPLLPPTQLLTSYIDPIFLHLHLKKHINFGVQQISKRNNEVWAIIYNTADENIIN